MPGQLAGPNDVGQRRPVKFAGTGARLTRAIAIPARERRADPGPGFAQFIARLEDADPEHLRHATAACASVVRPDRLGPDLLRTRRARASGPTPARCERHLPAPFSAD